MSKFYRKDIGKRKKEFYKVYDEMPDSVPEVFKRGILVAYDKCSISCFPMGPIDYEIHWSEHTMTGKEEIEAMFKYKFQTTEITEEEFEKAKQIIKSLAKDVKGIYSSL